MALLAREKRSTNDDGMNGFSTLLKTSHSIYGVFTHKGDLANSTSCTCSNKPTSKVRKIISTLVAWDDDLVDLHSEVFKQLKLIIETKIDDLYTANDYLLQDGYAGATVIGLSLVELDVESTGSRRKRNVGNSTSGANTTATNSSQALTTTQRPTTTTTPKPINDRVRIEVEIVFAGRENQPAPMKDLDNILAGAPNLGLQGEPARAADCKGETLPNLLAPSFMTTSTSSSDLVPSGQQIQYKCSNPGEMLPFEFDHDSNFALEVNCVDGAFIRPVWPQACVVESLCSVVPNPPDGTQGINLIRQDNRTQFRHGEFAYFACQNPVAVLDDDSGRNVYEIECLSDGTFGNVQWPNCYLEPTCTNLPDPPVSSKMVRATKTTSVKLGDYVLFECAEKDKFYETEFVSKKMVPGPTMPVLCEGTPENPTINLASTWPECKPLSCVPMGQSGLNFTQSVNVLETSCASNDTYTMYTDAQSHEGYIIPKRFHCGTYKPNDPTHASKCLIEEHGPPKIFWNEMEITSMNWNPQLTNAKMSLFKNEKAEVEKELNAFYLAKADLLDQGYLRTVVVKFHQGALKGFDASAGSDQYCVKVTVEHQFQGDTTLDLATLKNTHRALVQNVSGHLSDQFSIVADTIVSDIQKCHNDTLSPFFNSKYVVTGADDLREIGETVTVHCAGGKFLRKDQWDEDDTDNTLTIRCKPNRRFDVPPAVEFPDCAAKCPAQKPVAPPEHKIVLNTNKSSNAMEAWENEEIWYICESNLDGLAGLSPNGKELEGTDLWETSIKCGATGNYVLPRVEFDSNVTALPKCLPRPRRCQCLGDMKTPASAKTILDLYCRNVTSKIMPGNYRDAVTMKFMDEVVPSKIRCGSRDPLYMRLEDQCSCYPTDGEGAEIVLLSFQTDDGKWMTMEILNMEWRNELKDPRSKLFQESKYIVEKAMDEMYLDYSVTFTAQYVRSVVMAFSEGITDLTILRWQHLKAANQTNDTDIHTLNFLGDPILDIFEPTLKEKEAAMKAAELAAASDAETCNDNSLDAIFNFGLTHSNALEKTAIPISIGSTIDLMCARDSERVSVDKYDENPTDYRITLMCKPNGEFDFPEDDEFPPPCLAWCPGNKPVPPESTGLVIMPKYDNLNDTLEGDHIAYMCLDSSLGVNAGSSNYIEFKCINDEPRGRYDMPLANQTWPQCMKRTTTIEPPIRLAMDAFLKQSDRDLINRKTEELYLSKRNAGDEDLILGVLIPCMIVLLIVIMGCLCCTRIDNPLCKYCSKNYVPM
eukprot:TCALIF_10213-PA protein Name:"Protein of unknown function" AED:0.03 eAED:0.03 QI:9/0.8/0.81/1/1/1/16/76/1266